MIGIRVDPQLLPGSAVFPDGATTDVTTSDVTTSEVWIADHDFESWVRTGKVGPATLVWAGPLSGGEWRRADDLELFHLFQAPAVEIRPAAFSLRDRLFPARGFSAVEMLVIANVLVAGALLGLWQGNYRYELVTLMRSWHGKINHVWDYVLMLPTLFIHADAGHLFRNLLALVASAGAVEVFFGWRRTWIAYIATGFVGALFSYFGHARPPLSVGASGAIFGLAGIMTAFLFRFYPRFSERQRWKTRRIYAPLFLFLIPPSLFQADYHAHGGGFLAGILLGLLLPLAPEGEALIGAEVIAEGNPDR